MDHIAIKDFRSGTFQAQYEYDSFLPTHVYIQWSIDDQSVLQLLGEANRLLGSLDAYSDLVPDIDYFIRMHIAKEANTSSKIEGTQTSFAEVLLQEVEDLDPEKRDDWLEVNNYINAVHYAIEELSSLPISERLIKKVHSKLMTGARGQNKLPGQFRSSQNWIGSSLKKAIYVPPVHTEVSQLMTDLEKLINAETLEDGVLVPHLIRIAIIHYQFETIHPFLDGNGRIGRLLIILYLIDKGLLKQPTLYISDFFERQRREYYDRLTGVREQNDLKAWITFFLEGVIETAQDSIQTFKDIISLRRRIEFELLPRLGRKQKVAQQLIKVLYAQPILSGGAISKAIDKHPSSSNRLINDLIELDLLKELTGHKRNRIFAFWPYIELFS